MSTVPGYRVAPDDLQDLDRKTRDGLRPLLAKLNDVLTRVVQRVNAPQDVVTEAVGFTTNALGSSYAELSNPLASGLTPKCVQVANFYRRDGRPVDNVYGFWWTPTETGIRVLFVGLDAATTYYFAVRVQ